MEDSMQIYETLKNDHDELKALLEELVSLSDKDDYRTVLIGQIQSALVPHSRAEESVFYNAMRMLAPETKQIMHGFQEHIEAEAILKTLEAADTINADWKKLARKLKKGIEHHISEEENEIFAIAKNMFTDAEAESISAAFVRAKEKEAGKGFFKTSLDLIVNLLPPRFTESYRS